MEILDGLTVSIPRIPAIQFMKQIDLCWKERDAFNCIDTSKEEEIVKFASFHNLLDVFSLDKFLSIEIRYTPVKGNYPTYPNVLSAIGICYLTGTPISIIKISGKEGCDNIKIKKQVSIWANDCYLKIQNAIRDAFKINSDENYCWGYDTNHTISVPEDELRNNIKTFALKETIKRLK